MDIRKVKKLIELLEESNISEIEIQEGEESVRISVTPTALRGSRNRCLSTRSPRLLLLKRRWPLPPPMPNLKALTIAVKQLTRRW